MKTNKFSFNSLVLIVALATAAWFLFAVVLVDMAEHRAINDFYPIEGSDLAIRYHGREPNGIYRGTVNDCTLVLEGTFGNDWGAVAEGDTLYVNEYRTTSLGLITCDFVKIDLKTLEKSVIAKDSVLRGRCGTEEAVFVRNAFMPALSPEVNPLCELYAASSRGLSGTPSVEYLDTATDTVVYSVPDGDPFSNDFEARYLEGRPQA